MVNNNLITQEGLDKLKKERDELINIRRPAIIKQIQEAREQGDLSENADYDAAKNEQAKVESRIMELDAIIDSAKIIDVDSHKSNIIISVGSKFKIKDFDDDAEYVYEICGSVEADPSSGKISYESPLAKSLLNKQIGDVIEIRGIDKPYKVKVLKIF